MRIKLSAFRLPVDFGNEPVCPVPIERRGDAQNDVQNRSLIPLCGTAQFNGAQWSRARKQVEQCPDREGMGSAKHAFGWRNRSLTVAALLNGAPRYIVQNGKLELRSRSPRIANRLQRSNTSTLQRSGNYAFTLVEILVVLVLLTLIVFALMAVFSGIQRAFRASLTQSDLLEGGRAVMDMMANDLATMSPAGGETNLNLVYYVPVNFFIGEQAFPSQYPPTPLFQPLVSSPSGAMRTNLLENIFILSKGNLNGVPSWVGTGYSVNTNLADGTLYPLYRFYMTMPVSLGPYGPSTMFDAYARFQYTNSTEWSHLMDGVVNLTARAYDTNGIWMTNGYTNPLISHVRFVRFSPDLYTTDCVFYSNAIPASVQIELGTLEDRTLQHAEALSGANQSTYLSNAVSQVHLFRQRVWIRNVDPTAYQ